MFFRHNKSYLHSLTPILGLLALLAFGSAFSLDKILTINIGDLAQPGWQARNLSLSVDLAAANTSGFRLTLDNLEFSDTQHSFKSIALECNQGEITDYRISCHQGTARFKHALLGAMVFSVSFAWDRRQETAGAQVKGTGIAAGILQASLKWSKGQWSAEIEGRRQQLVQIARLMEALLGHPITWELQGYADWRAKLSGDEKGMGRAVGNVSLTEAAFSDPGFTFLGEELRANVSFDVKRTAHHWQGNLDSEMLRGAVLTPYAYVAAETGAIKLTSKFELDSGFSTLNLSSLEYRHPKVLQFGLDARLNLSPPSLQTISFNMPRVEINPAYKGYLQPLMAETLFEYLEWVGHATLNIEQTKVGDARVSLILDDVYVDDTLPVNLAIPRKRRFGLYGVNGVVEWRSKGQSNASDLRWQGGHFLERLTLGEGFLEASIEGYSLRLRKPARLAILDGTLIVDHLILDNLQSESGRLEFEGILTPISMEQLSEALDWPLLSGKLSGVIPSLTYQKGSLEIGGNLLVRIFDGNILIRDLKLQEVFGVLPRLYTDIELKDLDLQTLTRTFSFGKITGRLNGQIDGLYLENWRPIAFDAEFATPENDRSRHRISQKAVDNISNLGGAGVSGALSRSFLRFFEEFNYDRLGISCRLKQGVCHMGGIAPAEQGYFLVIGEGLPQINIRGFTQETDWEQLVNQLIQITETGSVEIR